MFGKKRCTRNRDVYIFLRENLRCHWNMSENLVKGTRINKSGSNVHRSIKLVHNIDMYGAHNAIRTRKNVKCINLKKIILIHPSTIWQCKKLRKQLRLNCF